MMMRLFSSSSRRTSESARSARKHETPTTKTEESKLSSLSEGRQLALLAEAVIAQLPGNEPVTLALCGPASGAGRAWREAKEVSELLDAGASVAKLLSVYGTSALHVAAECGRFALARVVLEKSPKYDVAKLVNLETRVTFNVRVGQTYELVDLTGVTPLYLACAKDHFEVARLLVKFGADPDKGVITFAIVPHMTRRCTPLTALICGMMLVTGPGSSIKSVIKSVRLLLELGADPDKPDESGRTPLSVALERGRLDIFLTLLQNMADANCKRPSDNKSPIEFARGDSSACESLGRAAFVKALLDHGAKT